MRLYQSWLVLGLVLRSRRWRSRFPERLATLPSQYLLLSYSTAQAPGHAAWVSEPLLSMSAHGACTRTLGTHQGQGRQLACGIL